MCIFSILNLLQSFPLRSRYHQQCIQAQILIYYFQSIWSKFINAEKKFTATLEGFEKKDDAANRTRDTIEKIRLVLQLLLTNTLIHALRKSSKYE